MRNVTRGPTPPSLRNNAAAWTKALTDEIRLAAKQRRKITARFYTKYDQPDVREALHRMYAGLCCYCESRVAVVAFENIEHRRPKRKFPSHTFRWKNLNLACPRCNNTKLEQWNRYQQILDATVDDPIEAHLGYRPIGMGVQRRTLTHRGRTTVDHAGLDREDLVRKRGEIFLEVCGVIDEIRAARNAGSPEAASLDSELRGKMLGEYGTLIEWAIAYAGA